MHVGISTKNLDVFMLNPIARRKKIEGETLDSLVAIHKYK